MTGHLPPRRDARALDFELFDGYACQGYSAHFSEFAPGDLAEVFLRPVGGPNAKVGMPLDTMAKDLSVLFSIARRYGAPVAVIIQALSQEKGGMMLGPLGEFLRLHAALPPEAAEPVSETPAGPPAGGSGGAAAGIRARLDGSSAEIPDGLAVPVGTGGAGVDCSARATELFRRVGEAIGRLRQRLLEDLGWDVSDAEFRRAWDGVAVTLRARDSQFEPADPKELQNDGDPIAKSAEIWPVCAACRARHSLHVHCTSERRHTRVMQ